MDHPAAVQLSTSGVTPPAWVWTLPTATHAAFDGHDTPASATNAEAGAVNDVCGTGSGEDCTDQVAPFQRSTSPRVSPPLSTVDPTAVHALADGHETEARPPDDGADSIDQALPFHRSTIGTPAASPPTAVQAAADAHDTALRVVSLPDGFGELPSDHRTPFHRSTSVRVVAPLTTSPTVTQSLADTHETPKSAATEAPLGAGAGWLDQRLPFHRSTSGTTVPARLASNPTAMQSLDATHDTPVRKLLPDSAGVDWIVHFVPFQRSTRIFVVDPLA
jgi:hypothetical protein